ncbi:hypothetical protein Bpfe_021844 [Biomphalaria pfeifferi]|uniref:Uncharacterized protein n=1 Tax=Biomphalaria pfeifferi TaxID=112525 RepID=A0AAD8B8M1_BIOPF|nr:hypothetical protein Bpfe_021844 [Biomphalaria pfeifferi]
MRPYFELVDIGLKLQALEEMKEALNNVVVDIDVFPIIWSKYTNDLVRRQLEIETLDCLVVMAKEDTDLIKAMECKLSPPVEI